MLRPWTISDLSSLVQFANNQKIAQNMTDGFPHPYTENAGRSFIEKFAEASPPHVMAIVVNEVPCGSIGLHFLQDIFRKNAELGYWLAEPYWGQGIIPEAIGLMVEYGFSHFDIDRIFARPFGRNIASRRALEKAGFILEAIFEKTLIKNGVYEDEYVYAIRRR
jgi:RimJ/RimL family protein N-acetyltransferase